MPLILTSSFPGEGNDEVFRYLTQINANPRIAWIAPVPDVSGKYFQIARDAFAKHGFTRVRGIELDDMASAGVLGSAFDFVYLTGGNPIIFRDNSLRAGLSSRLQAFLDGGGLIIGASGGAMVLTRNVALFRLEGGTLADAVASHDALKAMGLLDYEVLPHANRFGAALRDELGGYARRVGCDVIALHDGAAIIHATAADYGCIGTVTRYTSTGHVQAL
jgi:dipeptidase E